MSVTRDEVIWGYRFILGRDPESDDVISDHQTYNSLSELRKSLLNSEEFRNSGFDAIPLTDPLPPMSIELPTSPESIDVLWDHVQWSWEELGSEKPHFSVITNRSFLPEKFEKNESEFWLTGQDDQILIENTFNRNGINLKNIQSLLEFGCGVGRATSYLSRIARKVYAVDISQFHLNIAEEQLKRNKIGNVELYNLSKTKLQDIPSADLVYTRLVLQHNSPPLIKELLTELLHKVNKGGSIVFQLPVYMKDYVFNYKDYLNNMKSGMEMHCLPQSIVFDLLAQMHFEVIEVREIDDIGNRGIWISNTFLARRND